MGRAPGRTHRTGCGGSEPGITADHAGGVALFFSSRRRHTRCLSDWSSDVCSSDLQIFRGYLRCLDMDFQRVCMALKLVLLHSEQDRPDLSALLVHHRIMFATGLLGARFRLFLYRWGICTVDVTSLLRIFDVMRIELRTLVPAAMPVCEIGRASCRERV